MTDQVPSREPDVASPCRQQCQLDTSGTHCTGCQRTLAEIAGWSRYSNAEKRAVWARLMALPVPVVREKRCERCGAAFGCGSGAEDGGCWCNELPQVLPLSLDGSDCLCPGCLKAHMAAEYRKRGMTPPPKLAES